MEQHRFQGYLVVLAEEVGWRGQPYAGVERIPSYYLPEAPTDHPEETDAMNLYVFGDVKDYDSNLIPDLESARLLLAMLENSPRGFEIIYCSDDWPTVAPQRVVLEPLGFDVAVVTAGYWSIVDDFAPSPWANRFNARLNEHGLFSQKQDAVEYVDEYRARGEADADSPFDIVHVARVLIDVAADFAIGP